MLLVLTDVLTCPRCGPQFGLVMLADVLENRRVQEGSLGCANCREMFPIRGGLADLRFPPLPPPTAVADSPEALGEPSDAALRLAALLGVTGGPGLLLVAGEQAASAGEVAALVPDVGIVAIGSTLHPVPDHPGVSRILSDRLLPLRSASTRGVALTGAVAGPLLEEGVRVLGAGARLVLDPAPTDARDRLHTLGLSILLHQDNVLVASSTGGR